MSDTVRHWGGEKDMVYWSSLTPRKFMQHLSKSTMTVRTIMRCTGKSTLEELNMHLHVHIRLQKLANNTPRYCL